MNFDRPQFVACIRQVVLSAKKGKLRATQQIIRLTLETHQAFKTFNPNIIDLLLLLGAFGLNNIGKKAVIKMSKYALRQLIKIIQKNPKNDLILHHIAHSKSTIIRPKSFSSPSSLKDSILDDLNLTLELYETININFVNNAILTAVVQAKGIARKLKDISKKNTNQ